MNNFFSYIRFKVLKPILKDTFIRDILWFFRSYYHIIKQDKLGKGIIYDKQTIQIIQQLKLNANCIDVGCNHGIILKDILKYHPKGKHYAFEPILELYEKLLRQFPSVNVQQLALSDSVGEATFYFVESMDGYSGLQMRQEYGADPNHVIKERIVKKARLDDVIPDNFFVDFIKIDVEGGEFDVLKGANNLIKRCKPIVLFEFEKSAGYAFDVDCTEVYKYITECLGMKINTLTNWLGLHRDSISLENFSKDYNNEEEFYFICYY